MQVLSACHPALLKVKEIVMAKWLRSIAIALTIGISFFAGTALAADYLGSGQFSSRNINRCFFGTTSDSGGSYTVPNQNASAKWSATTDLNMYYNCSDWHIAQKVIGWGETGEYGYAYICAGSVCDSAAWNSTFTTCEARSNSDELDTWSQEERQFNVTHEMGHCYSLGHRGSSGEAATSVMRTGKLSIIEPNTKDKQLVNDRY
jgi:hypothetical protein